MILTNFKMVVTLFLENFACAWSRDTRTIFSNLLCRNYSWRVQFFIICFGKSFWQFSFYSTLFAAFPVWFTRIKFEVWTWYSRRTFLNMVPRPGMRKVAVWTRISFNFHWEVTTRRLRTIWEFFKGSDNSPSEENFVYKMGGDEDLKKKIRGGHKGFNLFLTIWSPMW